MNRRRRRRNPWLLIVLVILVAGAVYVDRVVVPVTPPLFVPTPTPTRSPGSFATDAENYFNQGKLDQAIAAYKEALRSDPNNAAFYIALAKTQMFAGNYEEAKTNAENALLINPNNSMGNAVRGWALGYLEDYLPAEAALKQAIQIDPNNAIAHAFYAEMLAKKYENGKDTIGDIEKAADESNKAVALDPNLIEVRRARGIVLEVTGNSSEAISQYQAAIEINPNLADLHLALGRNYRVQEQYDLAVDELIKANSLNPKDPNPNYLISRTLATVGQYANAIQYAQDAASVDPSNPFWWGNLGFLYRKDNQLDKAVEVLRLAVRGGKTADGVEVKGMPLDYGKVTEYYYNYGLALSSLNQCSEAVQIAQLLVQGVPNDDVAQYNAQVMMDTCKANIENPTTPEAGTGTPVPAETPATSDTASP